jgi:probable rRNA maturation factor
MTRVLAIRNRQRTRAVDSRLLRRFVAWLLHELIGVTEYEFGIHLVGAAEMARVNQQFLQHSGSTDVITFDHGSTAARAPAASPAREAVRAVSGRRVGMLHGELWVSVDDAVGHARRFGTSWQREIVRYIVHGLLHLEGYDDRTAVVRRVMKREENRIVAALERQFAIRNLARKGT